MPRFTIIQHQVGAKPTRPAQFASTSIATGLVHWDWLFEPSEQASAFSWIDPTNSNPTDSGRRLWTWATDPLFVADESVRQAATVPRLPSETIPAIRLSDHRGCYLDFEGVIEGGRGTVSQIATGRYRVLSHSQTSLRSVLTIKRSRFLDCVNDTVLQIDHLSSESGRSPSRWTLRTETTSSDDLPSTRDASL